MARLVFLLLGLLLPLSAFWSWSNSQAKLSASTNLPDAHSDDDSKFDVASLGGPCYPAMGLLNISDTFYRTLQDLATGLNDLDHVGGWVLNEDTKRALENLAKGANYTSGIIDQMGQILRSRTENNNNNNTDIQMRSAVSGDGDSYIHWTLDKGDGSNFPHPRRLLDDGTQTGRRFLLILAFRLFRPTLHKILGLSGYNDAYPPPSNADILKDSSIQDHQVNEVGLVKFGLDTTPDWIARKAGKMGLEAVQVCSFIDISEMTPNTAKGFKNGMICAGGAGAWVLLISGFAFLGWYSSVKLRRERRKGPQNKLDVDAIPNQPLPNDTSSIFSNASSFAGNSMGVSLVSTTASTIQELDSSLNNINLTVVDQLQRLESRVRKQGQQLARQEALIQELSLYVKSARKENEMAAAAKEERSEKEKQIKLQRTEGTGQNLAEAGQPVGNQEET